MLSNFLKKYLQCVLAARILTVDFVVCTVAVGKKNQGRFRHVGSDNSLVRMTVLAKGSNSLRERKESRLLILPRACLLLGTFNGVITGFCHSADVFEEFSMNSVKYFLDY
jgi:hypothetical protein